MIESAFPGGNGGGTVETITAGTGITVNSTDPANPIVTNSAPGDTTYTVTINDCENTTTDVNMLSFTVPANTWANGERVKLELLREISNQSGSSVQSTTRLEGTGITATSVVSQTIITATNNYQTHEYHFVRFGNTLLYSRVAVPTSIQFSAHFGSQSGGTAAGSPIIADTSVDFTNNITVNIFHQWSVANSTIYQRVHFARASKQAGQQ